jgi:hypothetical protein
MTGRFCLRCKAPLLECQESIPECRFFDCPRCGRRYTLLAGKELTFRWLHPISLLLYPVIFREDPIGWYEDMVATARETPPAPNPYGRPPPDPEILKKEIQASYNEIMLELEEPTQNVRDILDCVASEEDLRRFLRSRCESMKEWLDRRPSPPD